MSAATGAAAITLSEFDIIKNDEIAALESIFEKDFTRERFGSVLFIGKQARMEEDWKVEPAQKSQPMFSIKVRPTLFQSSYVGHNQTQEVNIHQKFQQSNKPVKRSTSNSSSASSSSSSSSSAASLAIDDLLVEELITLHIMFRKEYPQKIPRIWIATTSESISRDELDALLEQLIELAKEKSKLKVACVFELVEHIRNFLLERRTKRHDKARAHMRAINAAKLQEEEGENLHELYERNEKERLEEQKRQQRLDSDEDDRKEKQAFVIDDDAVQEAIRKKDQAYASKLIKAGEKPQQANTNVHEETKPTTNVVDILHNVKNPLSRYENDFEEIEVLGVGGGGEVRRCRNRIDGMEYAIKRVKLGQNDQENRRMVKEASNLARVTHPHIIRYIQSWIEEERIDSSLEKIDEKGNDLTGESMSDEEDESEEEDEDENSDEEEEEEDSEEDDDEEEDDDFGFTFARPDKNVKMDDFEIDDDEEEEDEDILGGFHFQDPDEHHDGNQSDDAEEQAFGAIWSYHSSLGSNARGKRGLGDKNNSNKKKTNLQGSNKDHKSGGSKNKHDKLTGSSSTDTSEVSKTKRNSPRRYLYIQMEYAPGKTLREAIDGGDLYQDQEKSFKLLRQIVEALAYLHDTCHLIHRDIKPQNVFLDSEFNVKVGDFGLATVHKQQNSNREDVDEIGLPLPQSSTATASDINQMVDRKIMLSRNSEVGSTRSVDITRGVGTTLYRAPEVSQKGVVYDQAADMWSLGITFFEMLHPPIATGMERIRTIMNIRENPRNLSKYSFLPPKAISILVDLLQHDPSKRPAAAQLLQSGRLPGKIESESKYFNEVLSVVATPNSTVYGRLIGSLFEQPPRPEIFSTYDHDPSTAFQTSNSRISQSRIPPRQVQLRATGYLNTFYLHNTQAKMRAITLIESISRQLLELYGFIELQTPLLLPKIQDNKGSDGSIGDIGSAPGQQPALFIDELGVVVQLPTSLALSFTRWLALHSDVLWLKRFEIGRIFNAAEAAGGQPKSRRLIEFDSVLPVTVGTPTLCTAFVEVILCSWKIVHECIKGNLARSTTQIFEKTRCFVEIGHALFQDSILRMIGIPKKNRVSVANMLTEIIASISVSSQLSGGKGWWNEAKRRMSMLTAQGTENPSLPPLLNQNQIELLRGFLHICLRVDATPHVKKQVKDKTAGNNPNRRKQTGFITNKSIDEDEDEVNENDEDDFDDFEKEKPLTAQTSNQTTGSSQVREAFLERIFQEFRDEVDRCAKKMKIEIENVNSFKKSNQYLTLSVPVIDQLRERILDSINECSLTVKHLSMSIGDDSLRFSPWGAKPNEFEKCYFKIIVLSRSLDPSKHVSAEKEMSRQMQMNLGYASIGSKMVKIGSMKRKNQAPLESFIASEGGRLDNILEFNSSRIRLQTTVHSSTPPPPGVNLGDSSGVQRAVISSKVSVDKLARFISFVARYLSPSPCSVLICAPSDDADFPPPQRAYLAEKIRAHNISCEWQHPWGLTSDAVLEYARLQGIPIVLSQTWNLGKVMYRVRTTALASIGASDTDDKATNIPSIMKRNLVSTPLHSGTQTQSSSATQTNPGAIPSGSGLANAPIAQAIAFDRKLDESELFTYLFRLLGL